MKTHKRSTIHVGKYTYLRPMNPYGFLGNFAHPLPPGITRSLRERREKDLVGSENLGVEKYAYMAAPFIYI